MLAKSPAAGLDHLGVGLFTMQSTASAPANPRSLYRRYVEDVQILERHGLHSAWSAEHRGWYDGWCPAPLHVQAYAAAHTTKLRFGTAILLLPQHDPVAFARAAMTLDHVSKGRVEVGVGLGYRDAEFDAFGIRRDERGILMDRALKTIAAVWAGDHGDHQPFQQPAPRIWVGGMSDAAIRRAARHRHGLMLPQTVDTRQVRDAVERYRSLTTSDAPIGVLRDVWIESNPKNASRFLKRLHRHYQEEAGSWWVMGERTGFEVPYELERQLARVNELAAVGSPGLVSDRLNSLFDAGVDLVVARLNFDFVLQADLHDQIANLAEAVAPHLTPRRALPCA